MALGNQIYLRQYDPNKISGSAWRDIVYFDLGPSRNAYSISSIEGLEPVKGELSSSPSPFQSGAIVTNAYVGMRNVIHHIRLQDTPTMSVREAREFIHDMFPVGMYVLTSFMDGKETLGYVESIEGSIFSDNPDLTMSIICENPYIEHNRDLTYTVQTNRPIDLSDVAGSGNSGFKLVFETTGAYNRIRVKDGVHPELVLFAGSDFTSDRYITIDTRRGRQGVFYSGTGVYSQLGLIEDGSLNLSVSSRNADQLYIETSDYSTVVNAELTIRPSYLGV